MRGTNQPQLIPGRDPQARAPMRALAGVLALAALLGGAAPALAGEPVPLIPDLAQDAPSQVGTRLAGNNHSYVEFASAVENHGGGPYEVRGQRLPNSPLMEVRQVVHYDDGKTEELADPAGTFHYEVDSTHQHWHFLPFGSYELRDLSGALLREGEKTGYCVGDRFPYEGAPFVAPAVYDGAEDSWCRKNKPDWMEPITMGLSIGWTDLYDPWREGQRIDVTDIPAGRYHVVHRLDPTGRLDANPANDVSSVQIELSWPDGPPPSRASRSCARASRRPPARGSTRRFP